MFSPLRVSPGATHPDPTIPLAQAQAWLQNALNALYYGADTAQATAMLRKVEEYLDKAALANGSSCIESPASFSRVRFGVKTDRGNRYRSKPNEDNFFATCGTLPHTGNPPFGFFVVADGMGGHGNGQMASGMVIQHLTDAVLSRLLAGETRIHGLLVEGIQSAHQAILQRNQQSDGTAMGSLVTTALIVHETATIANVGDSRVYLYRPTFGLQQITRDHSIVATLVAKGIIKPEDIYTHPNRNQVYRAIGTLRNSAVEVDLFTLKLEEGDKLLLCSDGLWEMVRDPVIENLMQTQEDPISIANKLYEAALRGGGQDNIGVVVVEYGAAERDTGMLLPFSLQETDPLTNEDEGRPATAYLPIVPKNNKP